MRETQYKRVYMGKTSLGYFGRTCEGTVAGRDTDREHNGAPGALALFSFLIWMMVTWICLIGENSSKHMFMICVLFHDKNDKEV